MCSFKKNNVEPEEYQMYKHVQDLNIINIPPILNYNKETKVLETVNIDNMNVSDQYGEEPDEVPIEVFDKIRYMINKLYEYNIIYPDITGYNFIKEGSLVWIIDFEHAHFITKTENLSNYPNIVKFMDGENIWNDI